MPQVVNPDRPELGIREGIDKHPPPPVVLISPYFDLKAFDGIFRLIALNISTYGAGFAMSRHTKTPWRVIKKDKYYAVCAGNAPLALVFPDYVKDKNTLEANASLIANAPLLLETLKLVAEHLENCMIVTCDGFKINDRSLRQSVFDVIMKAEGYRN
jgi:hypothetical protein